MKIAIIDDEQDARFVLNRQLQKSDVPISDIQEAEGVLSGYKLVQQFEPDLIFLDIKMYDGTGFDLLRQLDRAYPVIFVTAYDEFAIKAIKHQALDYLLKPVRQDSLNEALQTFQKSMLQRQRQEDLRKSLRSKPIETVIVGNINGFEVLSAADIYFFEGANQYTQVQLKDDTITSSKGLVHYDELLKGSQFI
ncbi:MAG: response regulator, partial [Bacteroidota bacterium]